MGLRRPLRRCAASRVRRPRWAGAPRRRGARGGARGAARRRLQPRRPRKRGAPAHSGRTSRAGTRPSGATRSTTASAARARVGDPERRAVGARLPHRRPSARRRARDPRRLAATHLRGARGARARRAVRARSSSRRCRSATGGRSTSGGTTRSGPTACTTSCTSCSPASRTATTRASARSTRSRRLSRGRATTRDASSSSPRTTTRSATARPATGCHRSCSRSRPPSRSSRRARRSSSWARSTFEQQPFQFFTDHVDPSIAEATREGRKREFEAFAAFSGEAVPDPQSVETFLRSKLSQREPDPLVRELLALRREPAARAVRGGRRGCEGAALAPWRRRARGGLSRQAGRDSSLMDVWPGDPFPLGPTWDGRGTNFALFSENAERVELCLFDPEDRETAHRADRAHGVQLALLHPGSRARPALRLSRARCVRPRDRTPVQSGEAPHRPVRKGDRRGDPVGPRQRAAVRAELRRGRRPRAGRRGRRRRRFRSAS